MGPTEKFTKLTIVPNAVVIFVYQKKVKAMMD